jgi:tol-pal system protein YbgF
LGVLPSRFFNHEIQKIHNEVMIAMKSTLLSILVCFLLLSGCVSQSELTSLDTRLNELEIRNAEAQKNSQMLKSGLDNREGEEQALRHQAASLRAKMDALNEEMRTLTGRIEEIQYLLNRQTQVDAESVNVKEDKIDRLAKTAKSNDDRIYRIEQYLNFEPSKQIPSTEKPVEKSTTKIAPAPAGQSKQELPEDEIYRLAKQAFDQGDSDAARKKFQELIQRYPNSERTDNAQFWIGEIYYREKWYEKAILEYQKVIEKYPKGNKVPASLLKQGFAFSNLGDKSNSRLILEELIKKYPNSNEAKIAKDKVKELN